MGPSAFGLISRKWNILVYQDNIQALHIFVSETEVMILLCTSQNIHDRPKRAKERMDGEQEKARAQWERGREGGKGGLF